MREFLKVQEASAIREHFFVRNDVPYVAILVTLGLEPAVAEKAGKREPEWRYLLSKADHPLFSVLRDCHFERTRREGMGSATPTLRSTAKDSLCCSRVPGTTSIPNLAHRPIPQISLAWSLRWRPPDPMADEVNRGDRPIGW